MGWPMLRAKPLMGSSVQLRCTTRRPYLLVVTEVLDAPLSQLTEREDILDRLASDARRWKPTIEWERSLTNERIF